MPAISRLLDALRRRGWTLAVAESMTGGMLGARLTEPPGASGAFVGGVVTYVDAAKAALLGVDARRLAEEGAVTRWCAEQMARGARERFDADLALSVTGIAGPDAPPGTEVGLVYLGLATRERAQARELHFGGDRRAVREQAAEEAVRMALAHLGEPA